jgi:sugar-specific transcriptional regulator TrmB
MVSEQEAENQILKQTLNENLGMTQYESDVYLCLVRGGKQSMSRIAESTDVPKQRVYDTVKDLRDQGLVEIIDEYPKKAYAIDPQEALSPVQKRIEQTQDRLDELHQTVEEIDTGVTLFKSESVIKKHIGRLIQEAEDSLFLLIPVGVLDSFQDALLDRSPGTDMHLIISNVEFGDMSENTISVEMDVSDLADDVRGTISDEPLIVSADRQNSFYWTGASEQGATAGRKGFYISNSELANHLDRFLSDMRWPLARSLNPEGGSDIIHFPEQYQRMRNCLSDLAPATNETPIESFTIEFEGYDVKTGEKVTKKGMLAGYHFSKYDVRAYLKVELDADAGNTGTEIVTVGDRKSDYLDFAATRITVYEDDEQSVEIDEETRRHLETLRAEFQTLERKSVMVGFDAFIDREREIIDEKQDESHYKAMGEFESLRDSVIEFEASDGNPALQWAENEIKPGGQPTHLATVYDNLSYDILLIGKFGEPVHQVFAERFGDETIVSVGEPPVTEYITFDDGEFLLTEPTWQQVDWNTIVERVGLEQLADYVDGVETMSLATWCNMPTLPSVCDGLRDELWPMLTDPPSSVVISPSNIEDISSEDIRSGIKSFSSLDDVVSTTVVLDRTYAGVFSDKIGVDISEETINRLCTSIYERIDVSKVVVHTMFQSALANDGGIVNVRAPRPSHRPATSLIEHFETGLVLGHVEDLSDGAKLILSHSIAGHVLRYGEQPDEKDIRSFVNAYGQMFE